VSRELRAEIEIDAPADRVWHILTHFGAYPEWNPFIRRIGGTAAPGQKLEVRFEPPDSRGVTLRPTVLTVSPQRELAWLGHLGVPKLFDGEHHFVLESLETGRTRLVQREVFGGLFVPLFGGVLRNTERGFELMNRALKARAENAAV
jgi:hypothetical protein